MTYKLCRRVIANNYYTSQKDYNDMMNKLDVFLLSDRLNKDQYRELVTTLKGKLESKI